VTSTARTPSRCGLCGGCGCRQCGMHMVELCTGGGGGRCMSHIQY